MNIKAKKIESTSVQELNERINTSIEDSNNGKLTEVSDLLAEIEEWS